MTEVARLVRAPTVAIAGVVAGAWIAIGRVAVPVHLVLAALGLGALAALATGPALKRLGTPGSVAGAFVATFPLVCGALAVGRPAAGLVPWLLMAWLSLVRALPLWPLAIAFVPASLILPARAGYGTAYFLIAVFAQLLVLVVATRALVGRKDGTRLPLDSALALELVALVAGRVA